MSIPPLSITDRRKKARRIRDNLNVSCGLAFIWTLFFQFTDRLINRTFGKRSGVDKLFLLIGMIGFIWIGWRIFTGMLQSARATKRCLADIESADIVELPSMVQRTVTGGRRRAVEAIRSYLENASDPAELDLSGSDFFILQTLCLKGDERMDLAVLRAVEALGDKSHLAFLNNLANGRSTSAASPEVKRRAMECVEVIERRLQEKATGATLLRGAENPEAPGSLLRASQSKDAIEEKTILLRSTHFGEE